MKPELVSVVIVSFNSRRYLSRCLGALLRQQYQPVEVVVVDNGSLDGTRLLLGRFQDRIRVIANDRNVGFAAGQNQGISASSGDWILSLNPDTMLSPDFIGRLVEAGRRDPKVGTVCGKLLRANPDLSMMNGPRIDSAGLYFTPEMRHFDRGWNEPDDGRYGESEYVFGASAAAALYRRTMVEDVSLDDGFFDPDFFAYREDADVAWRAQLLGWRSLYVPEAVAGHVRSVTPGLRFVVPAVLRMHSVKNRFLMRINNTTPELYGRCWLPATIRDLAVMGACMVYEHSSLPAFWRLGKCFRRALAKRRSIMSRRRVSDEYIAAWFGRGSAGWPIEPAVCDKPRALAQVDAAI